MRSWKTPAELQSDKSFHDWDAERLERSIFHKQDALSTLVNRCNCFRKRSSYYSNHKKKMATAVGPKRRLGQRSSNNHHSVVSSLILATRHLRLDKRMIFPMMLLNKQCNEIWKSYGCSKKFAQSAALHSNDHMTQGTRRTTREDHWWDRKRLELHEVTWKLHGASSCRREQASKPVASRRQVEQRRGGKAERLKLVIIYRATDIVCLFHCKIIDCYDLNEWLTIVRYNRFSPSHGACLRKRPRIDPPADRIQFTQTHIVSFPFGAILLFKTNPHTLH